MASSSTYSRMRRGSPRAFIQDALRLYRTSTRNIEAGAVTTRQQIEHVSGVFEQLTGDKLEGREILVVGAGQTLREVHGFGMRNAVTAIDLDVIPQGWKPGQYLQLLRSNGPVRTAKTIGRKALGVDRRFRQALTKELGGHPRPATHLQMDAGAMTFPDATFDFVYSFSVFEHLPDPERALRKIVRVLKPGGVLYISIHIYTAEGGCHDLRIFAGQREGIPYWAQLRPAEKHKVIESCYMNEWRISQWEKSFEAACQGVSFDYEPHHDEFDRELKAELQKLRARGEFTDYQDEELLTVNLRASWRK